MMNINNGMEGSDGHMNMVTFGIILTIIFFMGHFIDADILREYNRFIVLLENNKIYINIITYTIHDDYK